ncbi:MAG: SPOR domain-containing protein [Betaproteobacteria bacterium]
MATSRINISEEKSELSDIKRKLAWRMAFAGLMIVGLLGGLALFDHLSNQQADAGFSAPQFNEPVPVPKKTVTQPVTPVEPVVETKEVIKESVVAEATMAPVDKSAPKQDLPPRPEVAAQPVLPRASQPATRTVGTVNPPAPVAAPAKPVEAKAPAPIAAPARAEQLVQPAPVRLYSGFALQAGVFADPRRAEELHAKLTLEGIPSTIEARVQVGPFKTKEEAEVAREKMKALGIDAVMLSPRGARR